MISFRSVVVCAAVLGATSALAADAQSFDSEKYFTIDSVQVIEEPAVQAQEWGDWLPFPLPGTPKRDEPKTPVDEADLILDKIINMGKKVWAIVEAGKPVVNMTTNVASAVPQGLSRWDQLGGWEIPKARVYRAVYKNGYGASVVEFKYRVIYTYGGNVGGKGRYLTQVTVVPDTLNVAWGYTFNAEVTVPSVVNMGNSTDPMAGMELMVHWKVDTVMKHSESSTSYFVKGDGSFVDMTNGN